MNRQSQVYSCLFWKSLTPCHGQSVPWSSAVSLHLFPPLHFHNHQTSPALLSIPVSSLTILFPHSTHCVHGYLVHIITLIKKKKIALIILTSCLKDFNGAQWPQNQGQPPEFGSQGPHNTGLIQFNNFASHTPLHLHTAPVMRADIYYLFFVPLDKFLLS